METTQFNPFGLGSGIYSLPDVSSILGLSPSKVRRWMREYWNGRLAGQDQSVFSMGDGRELITNFYTMIEFYTFYQLRAGGVKTSRILKAHQVLGDLFNTPYPFATSNILTDGKDVLFSGQIGEIIHADETLQFAIGDVLVPFCKKIEFGPNRLARQFYPAGKDSSVVIDPARQFGQPIIDDTNILTETVFNLYRGGESVELIANIYDLTNAQVESAIEYHRKAA